MDETMTPTMTFRWLVPSFAACAVQPDCKRLQQLFNTSNGNKWVDVRMVEEERGGRPGRSVPSQEISND